jgi:ribonuclease G
MNKELFVSSTPHETKVGLVEDDLLAEVYLERENEYTLAGSIYKGRVTRVLPGMQSAFVDIGLERDAFLYVSDFMELEEQDEDLTDAVPTTRGVQDMRTPPAPAEVAPGREVAEISEPSEASDGDAQDFTESETSEEPGAPAGAAAKANGDQNRERGSWRGRRRRRGGRRDGRERGPEQGSERPAESRSAESRPVRAEEPAPRAVASGRSQPSGPPPGYQPMLLPGESISKYQRLAQQPAARPVAVETSAPEVEDRTRQESHTPGAPTFSEDEPTFAATDTSVEPLHAQHDHDRHDHDHQHEAPHDDVRSTHDEPVEFASTSTDWNREFRQPEEAATEQETVEPAEPEAHADELHVIEHETHEHESQESHEEETTDFAPLGSKRTTSRESHEESPAFAAPGTMEEETIDEEEADAVHYESSSDDSYEEFEEETQAAGQPAHLNGDAREAVTEIHIASLVEGANGHAPEAPVEEDPEELELEEAQAEAEALLDAEARGNGTVDARAEVRAPAGTAGYTQRAPRPRPDRGSERRGGGGGDRQRRGGRRFPRRRESAPVPLISDLLKEGQEILVQIAKEPIGKKGARITSHIALPGRFLVYMPTVNHTGVSRKISSEEERLRLKRIIMSERENGHGGFIVRTAAQSASEDELRADIRFLKGLWQDIKNRAEASKPPALIYHDLNVVERVLRDQVTSDFSVIWVDTEPEYERVLRFFNRFQPTMVKRVKLYTKETPLFEQFGLAEEMNKALKSKVWLKSGGYIVINQTEALVAIDINTGKYVGKTARLEDTIVKTNVDAIREIVRQIRLRDLGGIIIIDFIDMDERRNRQRVMQALEEELRHDRAPSKTLQFNDFGLVAITRKRVKQSLERTIGAPCPYCESTGYIKSVTTVCNEIYVEMRKIAKHLEHEDVMLRVHPDVAKELKGNNGRLLNEMEEITKRTIIVKSDPAVHQQQFDIN